jgi:hypothetical protein
LTIVSFSAPGPYHPNLSGESWPATGKEAAHEASGAPNPHAFLARYARVYDATRIESASVAEAMALVEAELGHDLEQRRR